MTSQRPVIVVGVDGSEASMDTLRWAFRQAELTGGRLRTVCAWRRPVTYGVPMDCSDVASEEAARRRLENALADALGTQSAAQAETVVVEGHPARVLVDAAEGADLLAVGSQGHGAFAGKVLGSTGPFLRATCALSACHRAAPSGASAASRRWQAGRNTSAVTRW